MEEAVNEKEEKEARVDSLIELTVCATSSLSCSIDCFISATDVNSLSTERLSP